MSSFGRKVVNFLAEVNSGVSSEGQLARQGVEEQAPEPHEPRVARAQEGRPDPRHVASPGSAVLRLFPGSAVPCRLGPFVALGAFCPSSHSRLIPALLLGCKALRRAHGAPPQPLGQPCAVPTEATGDDLAQVTLPAHPRGASLC